MVYSIPRFVVHMGAFPQKESVWGCVAHICPQWPETGFLEGCFLTANMNGGSIAAVCQGYAVGMAEYYYVEMDQEGDCWSV
jgi:hypothetical protein